MNDEAKQYRVRPGFHHGAQGQYGPGDVVKLTEAEAIGFQDKLELVISPTEETPEVNISKSALKWLEEHVPDLPLQVALGFLGITQGTGKDGQITLADVKAAAETQVQE